MKDIFFKLQKLKITRDGKPFWKVVLCRAKN